MAKEVKTQSDKSQRRISLGQVLIWAFGGTVFFLAGGVYNGWLEAREDARRRNDGGNVSCLLCAIESYAVDHDGWCPPDLATLVEENELAPSKVFLVHGSATPEPRSAADIRNGQCDFHYFGKGKKWSTSDVAMEPIIVTKSGVRHGEFRIVGYNDRSVLALLWIPRSIKELIKQSEIAEKKRKEKDGDNITEERNREQDRPADAGK